MDVAGIGIATRWSEAIEQTLRSCKIAVILIGKQWLNRDAEGARRIDHPDDALRAEIRTALQLNLKIVPLLVGGAAFPNHADLPSDVAPITDWQALRIDDDDFDHDVTRLIRSLEAEVGGEKGADPQRDLSTDRPTEIGRLRPVRDARPFWAAFGTRAALGLIGVLVVFAIVAMMIANRLPANGITNQTRSGQEGTGPSGTVTATSGSTGSAPGPIGLTERPAPPPTPPGVARNKIQKTRPAPPPTPPDATARNEIQKTLTQFCAAYEDLELPAIRRVFPTAPEALRDQLKQYKSVECKLTGPPEFDQLDATAGTAKVKVPFKQTFDLKVGGLQKPQETIATVALSRPEQRGTWYIASVAHKPKR
jgi:hypothetical protein